MMRTILLVTFVCLSTLGNSYAMTSILDTLPMPTANYNAGFYNNSIQVSLSSDADVSIYYTLDGSEPSQDDQLYNNPILIQNTTPLRAKAFKLGEVSSRCMSNTYFLDNAHSMMVVALSADPFLLLDSVSGLYFNYNDDVEIPVHVEFFENNATMVIEQDMGVSLHGTASTVFAQKSLVLKARESYEAKNIQYDFFDQKVTKFKRLLLRNSGQDWNVTMFRDGFARELALGDDIKDIIERPELAMQGFRPAIVYINGQYWGIHNIQERLDKHYIESHTETDSDSLDLIENYADVKEGSLNEWTSCEQFLLNTNLATASNYALFQSKIDENDFLDYQLFQILTDNYDWPGNNNRRWREFGADNKWRWLTFDFDFAFGIYSGNPAIWNTGDPSINSLARAMEVTNDTIFPNPVWATLPLRKALENNDFQAKFINRAADMINVLMKPSRMNMLIDSLKNKYKLEIPAHNQRWAEGFMPWDDNVQKLRSFSNQRVLFLKNHFLTAFPNLNGLSKITVLSNPLAGGRICINSINLAPENYPWQGDYFKGIEVPIMAIPSPGYVFKNWYGAQSSSAMSSLWLTNNANTIIANFEKGSLETTPVVINEINYNSNASSNSGDWVELHNPTNVSVNMSGWYLEDSEGQYFPIPASTVLAANGYLVMLEDSMEFKAVYPAVSNYIGEFKQRVIGFKLDNAGQFLQLKNADGIVIDSLTYDDASPWPIAADGQGPTLQLTKPCDDNALAINWVAQAATPGVSNGLSSGDNQIIVCSTDSLNSIVAYPSPATFEVYISFGAPKVADYQVTVYDVQGKLMHQKTMSDAVGAQSHYIDITDWPNGTFLINVDSKEMRTRGKFVKAD